MPSNVLYADDCDALDDSCRLRLRVASFLRGSALLRRRPETVAAHSRAGRPSASLSVERPPIAAQHWESFDVDFTEFKRKAFRELSGALDFHIRGADAPVPTEKVCSFWKQLVEDNLAIAARIRYPRKCPPSRVSRAGREDSKLVGIVRGLQSESGRWAGCSRWLETRCL